MKSVLILGGGFAGVESAIYLRKHNYNVTLVSDRDFFYIYPTSIWVPTHDVKFKNLCVDLKDLQKAHGFNTIISEVQSIQANTLSICGAPQQSMHIRDKLDALIKQGGGKLAFGFGGNPKDSSAVRGGPGFELLFNVHNMLIKKGLRDKFELTFFAPMQQPGARMGDKALEMMDMIFKKNNIHKQFGKKIKEFVADGVVFEDDSKLESDFTMFIPAGEGHDIVKSSDLPQNDAGFIKINDFCEVEGFDYIYAIGDVSAIQGPSWRAKQGHIAEVMARNTAYNIYAKDTGKAELKGYGKHLNILCVMDSGNGAAFVYRDGKKAKMIPMPIVGHWLKKGWGHYCRLSKLGRIPRIPGM